MRKVNWVIIREAYVSAIALLPEAAVKSRNTFCVISHALIEVTRWCNGKALDL